MGSYDSARSSRLRVPLDRSARSARREEREMKTWVIGGLAGVLVLGGLAAWMIGSGQDTDAPQVAPSARAEGATDELPSFDRAVGETRLAEPTPLAPAAGSP